MTGRKRDDIALVIFLGFLALWLVVICVVLVSNGGVA